MSADKGMKLNADKIERYIEEYVKKNPGDKNAMLKAVFFANQYEYMSFVAVRFINKLGEILQGYIFLEIIRTFEE